MKYKNLILLAIFISVFSLGIASAATTVSTQCGIFKDVKSTDTHCEAILYVYNRNIFKGYSLSQYTDGSADFKPNQAIIRAEVLKVALAAFLTQELTINKNVVGDVFPFSDLKGWDNQWWFVYLQEAMTRGMIGGYKDGTFKPQNNITRAEFLKVFLAGSPYSSEISKIQINGYNSLWADTPPTAWYAQYIIFANQKGLFANFSFCPSGSICPDKDITRAEVAQMIFNYHRYLNVDLGFPKAA